MLHGYSIQRHTIGFFSATAELLETSYGLDQSQIQNHSCSCSVRTVRILRLWKSSGTFTVLYNGHGLYETLQILRFAGQSVVDV